MGAENRTAAKIVALLAKRRSQRLRQGNGKSARIYELWRRSLESGPKTTSGKTARLSGRHGARLPADRKPEAKNGGRKNEQTKFGLEYELAPSTRERENGDEASRSLAWICARERTGTKLKTETAKRTKFGARFRPAAKVKTNGNQGEDPLRLRQQKSKWIFSKK
jgi:hypothetical protein